MPDKEPGIIKQEQRKITFCAVSLVNISKDLKTSHPLISAICETLAKELASAIQELPEARLHSINNYHNTKIGEEIEAIISEIKKDDNL